MEWVDVERKEEKQWDGGGRVGGGVGIEEEIIREGGGLSYTAPFARRHLIKLDWYSDDRVIAGNELP